MIDDLGSPMHPSPLGLPSGTGPQYVDDGVRVLAHIEQGRATATREKAGPRARIFFDPKRTRAAILTAGGLCPGTNNVIRAVALELVHRYGVGDVVGLTHGFWMRESVSLGPDEVRNIHRQGGTVLKTARGAPSPEEIVDRLVAFEVDILFAIGGDGTMRCAHAIAAEAKARGRKLAVVGIPKTIDNDVPFVDKTFGFETAVTMARIAIDAAHTEATSVLGGIGLVKTMGRNAGFIAAFASLASVDVNVCLVPEVRFELGELLAHLEYRLEKRGHAVIVVAEGCRRTDDEDVGRTLKTAIEDHLERREIPHVVKYIDPSYAIRSVAADAMDSIFCAELGRAAVHAAMAGKTDLMVGRLHRVLVHVPLREVASTQKRLDPDAELWLAVLESTGQPSLVQSRQRR